MSRSSVLIGAPCSAADAPPTIMNSTLCFLRVWRRPMKSVRIPDMSRDRNQVHKTLERLQTFRRGE